MALRSLSRAGMGIGGRVVAAKGGSGQGVARATQCSRHAVGAERQMSSLVGQGQGHFGDSHSPSYRQGSLGTGTQLFKLVETDLMSKELTRYGPSDAEHLGLHSVQDVLSEIAAATIPPRQPAAPIELMPVSASSHKAEDAPAVREEEVLAAWGLGPVVSETEEVEVVQAPSPEAIGEEGGSHEKMAIKRTYQPSTLKRKRKHGFLYRAKTRLGKKILRRRQEKGRWRLGI